MKIETLTIIIFFFTFFLNYFLLKIYLIKGVNFKNLLDFPGNLKTHKIKALKAGGIFSLFICSIIISYLYFFYEINYFSENKFWFLLVSILILGIICFIDDLYNISKFIRLLLQLSLVFLSTSTLRNGLGYDFIPTKLEILLIIYFWVYHINITNFYDGVDDLFVKKNFFILLFIFISSVLGYLPISNLLISILLIGIILSFYPFNKHPAKIFFGDTGSIVFGYLIAWMLINLAINGYLAASISIILFYHMDVSFTLLKRILQKKSIFHRHRDFYFLKLYDSLSDHKKFYKKFNFIILFGFVFSLLLLFYNNLFFLIFPLLVYLWILKKN
tara:strand:+ start:1207 stop:2196 length:990 start_codon:yes stop_codon:yes gene_type:complete